MAHDKKYHKQDKILAKTFKMSKLSSSNSPVDYNNNDRLTAFDPGQPG